MFLQKKKKIRKSQPPHHKGEALFLLCNLGSTKAVLTLVMGPPEAEAGYSVSVKAYGQSLQAHLPEMALILSLNFGKRNHS